MKMKYKFVNMNEKYASIIYNWKYEGEFSIYNYDCSKELLDPENWYDIYAVLDDEDSLVAEVTFYNNDITHRPENPFKQWDMFYGQGMRPDLVGKGYGPELIGQSIIFGIDKYDYKREYVFLEVLSFNKRAIRAYEKCGFELLKRYSEEYEGRIYDFTKMRYKNPKAAR
jgi:RimJ/RimL family protein N-acetyltransferase